MDIRQVRYALALAHYRSFTKAARVLAISQPALSSQISHLEKELGVKLFTRSTRSVSLTDIGKEFCEKGAGLIKVWEELLSIRESRASAATPIKIGVAFIAHGSQLLSQCMSFFERRPEYDVTYIDAVDEALVTSVFSGALDAALCKLPLDPSILPHSATLNETPILSEQNYAIVAKSHPFAFKKEVSLLEMQSSRFITSSSKNSDHHLLTAFANTNGLPPFIIIQTNDTSLAMQLVKSGDVVMLGPKAIADYYKTAAIPMVETITSSLGLIYPARTSHPILLELEGALKKAFR